MLRLLRSGVGVALLQAREEDQDIFNSSPVMGDYFADRNSHDQEMLILPSSVLVGKFSTSPIGN